MRSLSKIWAFPTRTYRDQIQHVIESGMGGFKGFDLGQLRELRRARGSSITLIARAYNAGKDFLTFENGLALSDPKAAAVKWWKYLKQEVTEKLSPEDIETNHSFYYEGFNEMSSYDLEKPGDHGIIKRYGQFEAARQEILANEGYMACIGNFAVGNPDISDYEGDGRADHWPAMEPALEACDKYRNLLGLHEYFGLWPYMWYGPNQSDRVLARQWIDFPATYDEGWLFGRYRKVWRRHIAPNGLTNIRIVLTEFGWDFCANEVIEKLTGGKYTTGALKTLGPVWAKVNNRPDTVQFAIDQLRWANHQMQRDPYLLGATMFAWGTEEDELWHNWNIEGPIGDAMLADTQSSSAAENARVVISQSGLNLRKYPSQEDRSFVKRVLPYGELVTESATQNGWSHVTTSSGRTGFVMSRYLKVA